MSTMLTVATVNQHDWPIQLFNFIYLFVHTMMSSCDVCVGHFLQYSSLNRGFSAPDLRGVVIPFCNRERHGD